MMDKPLLSLTERAADRVRFLLQKAERPCRGLRVSVKKTGCAGMSYDISYADGEQTQDILVQEKGVVLFVDPFASVFLAGMEIDYREDALSSGFRFDNPNAKNSCGCGESFTV